MSSHNRTRKAVQSLVTFVPNVIAQCLLPRATRTDGPSEDLQMEEYVTHCREEFDGPRDQATVNKLTDDALLDIFDLYLNDNGPYGFRNVDEWHTLVHV